jgi:hypothetical protein
MKALGESEWNRSALTHQILEYKIGEDLGNIVTSKVKIYSVEASSGLPFA